mmetsp:Transcript_67829/g.201864  ORF Transcript_67829/g.201864 Transcript_67829/m.201864 type:complete len:240 (-) Transcript_67829:235-954(-)
MPAPQAQCLPGQRGVHGLACEDRTQPTEEVRQSGQQRVLGEVQAHARLDEVGGQPVQQQLPAKVEAHLPGDDAPTTTMAKDLGQRHGFGRGGGRRPSLYELGLIAADAGAMFGWRARHEEKHSECPAANACGPEAEGGHRAPCAHQARRERHGQDGPHVRARDDASHVRRHLARGHPARNQLEHGRHEEPGARARAHAAEDQGPEAPVRQHGRGAVAERQQACGEQQHGPGAQGPRQQA